MPLYPLGISRGRDVLNAPEDAAGSFPIRWSHAEEVACAFIDATRESMQPMLHATALDTIHRRICVLPVRFGVALQDEGEIRSLLQDRQRELLDQLDHVDGTCEMGVRIALPSVPQTQFVAPSGPQSPLAYIEERRAHYRRTDENTERDSVTVRQFVDRVRGCYRQWRRLQSPPSQPIRLAFLVEQDRVAAFRNCLDSTYGTAPVMRCVILGPWPPYSFV